MTHHQPATHPGHSETLAPLAYKGKIIVGISGAEYGIRGFVTAYDAETGEQLWRTDEPVEVFRVTADREGVPDKEQ